VVIAVISSNVLSTPQARVGTLEIMTEMKHVPNGLQSSLLGAFGLDGRNQDFPEWMTRDFPEYP